jgi:hypothetical protein
MPTQGLPASREARLPARSFLKMNTVIRLASAFLRSPSVGMPSRLRGREQHQRGGLALRAMGDQPSVRSAIHLHGSAP